MEISLQEPASVQAGTVYALFLCTFDPDTGQFPTGYEWGYSTSDRRHHGYRGGSVLFNPSGATYEFEAKQDFLFKTFVETG